jgi:hypothetical protein
MHCQVQGEGVCMHVQKSIYLGDDFEPTCMAHPPTYLNKVLIGDADGTMQLRNINSDALLYKFNLHSNMLHRFLTRT